MLGYPKLRHLVAKVGGDLTFLGRVGPMQILFLLRLYELLEDRNRFTYREVATMSLLWPRTDEQLSEKWLDVTFPRNATARGHLSISISCDT